MGRSHIFANVCKENLLYLTWIVKHGQIVFFCRLVGKCVGKSLHVYVHCPSMCTLLLSIGCSGCHFFYSLYRQTFCLPIPLFINPLPEPAWPKEALALDCWRNNMLASWVSQKLQWKNIAIGCFSSALLIKSQGVVSHSPPPQTHYLTASLLEGTETQTE